MEHPQTLAMQEHLLSCSADVGTPPWLLMTFYTVAEVMLRCLKDFDLGTKSSVDHGDVTILDDC